MAILFDDLLEVVVPDTSSWEEIDLSVSPYNLPSNAVGIMVVVERTATGGSNVGLRMKGSTDDYINLIYLDEMRTFFIGVDASQVVECYNESADMKFWLVGYFDSDEAIFFVNGFEHSMGATPYEWTATDLPEVPGTIDNIAVFLYVSINPLGPIFGVRKTGCTDDYKTLFSLIGGAVSPIIYGFPSVKVDLYADSATRIWVVGYLHLNKGTFKDNLVDITPIVAGSWQTVDLSADAGSDDASAIILAYDQTGGGESYGIRSTASSDEFYHKADMENWYVVKLDGSKQFQAKISSNTDITLFLVGYLYGVLSKTRVPTGDSSVQWIPSVGTDNYANVDEYPAINDSDYNYTTNVSKKDKFTFTPFDVPAGSIIGVKVYVRGKCSDFIVSQMGQFIIVGGVEDDNVMPFWTDFQDNEAYWPLNPKTGIAWTVNDVNGVGANALQYFGYITEAGVGYTCTVSRIYIKVDYTPNPLPPPPPIPTNSELMRHLQYFHGGINYGCYKGNR